MKFLTQVPVTNDLQVFAADMQVHGHVGTAAGRGQPQLGAEPASTADTRVSGRNGATVTAAAPAAEALTPTRWS